ncbi:Polyisoprenoid-binding protein YceI [Cognatiyoonia koreensis]|uniref:Polyisoprenoid-binding protein YceI n=1 Tax=Cognatiyoonia koreensis TaxID=364200 RepID=A0A1I0QWT7_9RHOB|nr:YceI family protein [Cognatiyoonia koreensis]SEW32225.1 Polyisoprenoid-binding protein YceI [Cognatiyoonia koreensis]
MRFVATTAFITAIGSGAFAEMATYELDPAHTTVFFTVDHIGYAKTLGLFTTVSGNFMYDAATQELGAVSVNIDAASVESFNDARDEHLRKADFLDVSAHPAITFTATGGNATSATTGTVTGDLTILSNSLPVTLEVTLNKSAPYPFGHKRDVLGLSMNTTINRSEFGMTYGVDNGLVGDVVDIQIETEAMKVE